MGKAKHTKKGPRRISTSISYDFDKIVDLRPSNKSADGYCYRVRWKGQHPSEDSWEPWQCFYNNANNYDSRRIVDDFRNFYVNLVKKNKLVHYKVCWKDDQFSPSWENENNLRHAQDKITEFVNTARPGRKRLASAIQDSSDPHEKQQKKRNLDFWEAVEKGDLGELSEDLYSKVKRRTSRSHSSSCASGPPCTSGTNFLVDDQLGQSCRRGSSKWSRYEGLRPYDSQVIQSELLTRRRCYITPKDLEAAVQTNNYQTVQLALDNDWNRSPNIDYDNLLLASIKQDRTGVSSLLATRVQDLSITDKNGDNPLTLAAIRMYEANLSAGRGTISREDYTEFIRKCQSLKEEGEESSDSSSS